MTHPRSSASIRRRLAFSTALATGLVATLAPSTALAQVTNVGTVTGVVSNGGAPTIADTTATTTTITVGGSRTILNWNDLNVSNAQTLNFVVGANSDAVLNRVLGGGTTTINGNLSSYITSVGGTTGGQIFILNPNGVIFGGSAAVNVGGLVAGTLGLTDADFNNAGSYSFTGGTAGLLTVAAGANLSATNGPLVLVAGQLSNAGSLTSLGDIALVAASDVSMSIDPGSPVSMTIASGTTVNAALVAGGTISGRNVTMAVVGRDSVSNALLNVTGVVTATGASPTDRGVVLTAGAAAQGVTITGAPADIGGNASISQSGAINSATNVELRSITNIAGSGAITATGGDVLASAVDLSFGIVSASGDIALTGNIGNGLQDLALTAGSDIILNGAARGRDVALGAGGDIIAGNLDARDDVIASAGGNLTVDRVRTGITIDSLAPVDVVGAADTFAGGLSTSVSLSGNSAYLEAGTILQLNQNAQVAGALTLRAVNFAGQGVFEHSVGTLLRVIDRSGNIVISDAVSKTYGIALEAETGSIIVDNDITSTAGSLSLTASTPGEAIRLDDFNLTAGTSITLNGVTDVRDTVTIDAGTTATFNGAIIGDGQAGGSNDPDFLTIDSGTGTFFNGTVGSATANQSLQSLTVTGGASTLNAASIRTNSGIALAGLITGNQAAVTINAGSGALTSTGDISASQTGTALALDGSSITVTNVGSGATPFSTIGFNAPTNLGGNVTATGAITFTGNLVLLDDGNTSNVTTRLISSTGTSAITFQENISSQGNNVVGLAVSNPTGSVIFNKDVGLDGAALAALGIAAQTFNSSAVVTNGGKFRVGTLAINVAQGDIVLPGEGALTIGTVGSIVGLSTLAAGSGTGRIEVSTPNGSDLTINGQVRAFGSVILSAGDDLLGSAAITAGFNGGPATSDVTITAVDTVNTGSITAPDAVSVTGGGLVTTGAITSNSVAITGNGIRPGAITVQTSINLNGGDGGIGDGTRDLSLSTPGSITLTGEARGIDIALNSTAGGTITTGALRARDDVVIGTSGAISTGAISAGVTVDSLAAIDVAGAGDTLRGITLVGNDVALSGASIVTGAVRAIGAGSDIEFFNGATAIGSSLADLDLQAGGSIILPNVTAQGRDIALSAGTSISTGALNAADDVVIRAGTSATLGAVSATGGVDVAGAADTLAGRSLAGADADLSATQNLSYTSVTLGDDLTLRAQNLDAILLAPLPTVGGDISLTDTGGGLTITSFAAPNGSLTIATENGNLSVGGVSAADNVTLRVTNGVAGELILTGGVTAGAGDAVSLVSSGLIRQDAGVITAASLSGSSVGATTLSGSNVVTSLAGFTANGLTFNVTGPLTITNAVGGGSALNLTAGGNIAINALTGTSGIMTLVSGGAITQSAAITAAVLTGSSTGATTLANPANAIGSIGSAATATGFTSGGNFSLVDVGGLTIAKTLSSTGGGVSVDTSGALAVNANVTGAGTGIVRLKGTGISLLSGITVSTGSGAITIDSGAGVTSGATISTGGAVTIAAIGDLALNGGSVSGTGVALNATGGLASDILVNAAINGGTGLLAINAGGTVTSNAAGSLTTSGAGRVTVNSGSDMSLSGAIVAGSGGLALTSGGLLGLLANASTAGVGTIVLDSVGLMTLGSGITVSSGSGAITLDSDAGLTSSAVISTGGAVSATADGDLQLLAGSISGNGITLNAIGTNSDATINAALNGGAGGVGVTAGGTIISNASGTVTATGAGAINLDSGGLMTIGGAITGGTGAILLDSGGALTTSAAVSTGGSVTALANGNILIGGAVTGNGVTLDASGASSTLTINAPVNAGSGTLALTGPAGISQSAAGLLTAGLLTVSSNGLVNLGAATNAITALGAVNTAGFALLDAGGLILNGAVQGAGGVSIVTSGPLTVSTAISTTNAAITLNSGTGALNLAAAVNAGTGTVDLRGATIGQTAAGIVTAGTLTGLSTGATLLDTATNAVAAIGNFSAERLALRTGGALAITGNLTATGVASAQPGVALTASGISQSATSVVDGGAQAIRFDANGGTVTLAGTLRSSATGPAIAIVDAGAVSLGTVRAASGTLVLGETGAAVGAVTQTGPIEAAMLTAVAIGSPITLSNAANSIGALGPISASALTLTDAVGGLDIAGNLRIVGTLDLSVPNGAVTQSAGTIEAALLRGSSNGGATFTRAGNNIVALGPWTNANAGGLALTSAFALNLVGDIAAGTGPLSLSALSIAGASRTLTSGGVATLAATGGDLTVGTVTAGPSATLTATNAVIAGTVTAGAVTVSGASVDIGTATASSGALALTASSGLLRLGTGSAGTTATLIKQGTTGQLEIGTRLSTQGNVTVTSATNARIAEISAANGAIAVTASAGSVTGISGDTGAGARLLAGPTGSTQNLTVSATNWVRLGESRGGVISATGARLELTGAVTGTTSILFDNNGTGATRLGSAADSDGFSLGQAEMDFARAPAITIQSRANPIAIGDLTLSTATGATRLNLLTSGRIDVTGRFQGGLAGRTIQLGGITASNVSGGAAVSNVSTILAVSATAGGGGRLLFEGSTLDLRAAKIGVGQDVGFLGADGIGLTGTGSTPIVQGEVSRRFIGNSSSTLYRAAAPYSDPVLIKAGQIIVTYADYAVFQNGALAGTRAGGVTLAGSLRPMLSLNSSGPSGANAFAMFAEIDGRFGLEAAVLPRTFVELNNVNLGNTRINGCLAGSAAGGCIINNVAPPLINVFDAGRADVLNAAGDLPIAFDPIVGANNESLFAGLSSIEDIAADPDCKPDDKGTTCPAPERTQ